MTLWYPRSNREVHIPGASLASGMETPKTDYKPVILKTCDEDHKALALWNGKLLGLAGKEHIKNLTDVNVWLTDTYIPEAMFTYGIACTEDRPYAHILYPIDDMGAPTNDERFRGMLTFLKARLIAGQTVTVSCFGGHGRTGLVLACLVGNAGIDQAIAHIRSQGCDKWVESKTQIEYVSHILGVKQEASPSKGGFTYGTQAQGYSADWSGLREWPDRHDSKGPYSHF